MVAEVKRLVAAGDVKGMEHLVVKYQEAYENEFVKRGKGLFDAGKDDVQKEHSLKDLVIPTAALAWVSASARNIAQKQLNDLTFNARQAVLSGVSKELSEREVTASVRTAFDDYAERKIPISAALTVHKFYEEGREWTAEEAGLAFATWSAILDDATCAFCERRDGMTIRTDDPDFTKYSPGEVHANCRCLWVFRENYTGEETWKPISKSDQEEYYQ